MRVKKQSIGVRRYPFTYLQLMHIYFVAHEVADSVSSGQNRLKLISRPILHTHIYIYLYI